MTDPDLIDQCIEVFGGEQRFADAIPPAGRRVVLRWANGSVPVPHGVWREIANALGHKITALQNLRAAVVARGAGPTDLPD